VRAAFAFLGSQLDLFLRPAPAVPPAPAAPPRRRRPPALDLVDDGRWRWTRPWLESPHRARARRELEAVRAHFPELDGVAITVGLTRRRGVLGLASLGAVPTIWIRPRRIHRFALAHELVHLLQARGLVPGGEKTADLYALARSAAYVDVAPFYLRLPRRLRGDRGALDPAVAARLHALAARAVRERRGKTARGAVRAFERAVAETFGA
jgi:hypothetical protein